MHLILLVGTNPIPNYVAAMYGVSLGVTHYYLVHTLESGPQQATQNIAEALRDRLIKKGIDPCHITLVPLGDASNNETIYSGLETLRITIPENAKVILNYTGGTKAMAIHTYTWLEKHCPNKCKVYYQYLDARKHTIVTDSSRQRETEDLRDNPNLNMESIDTMLKLHGYKLKPRMGRSDPFPEVTDKLSKLIEDNRIETFFEMTRLLRLIYYDSRGICVTKSRLATQLKHPTAQAAKDELEKLIQSSTFLEEILTSFPEKNSILNKDNKIWTPTDSYSNNTVKSRTKDCIHDYLDGKWLEFHVLIALEDIATRKGLTAEEHFGHSMEASKAAGSKKFELDLFVLRGYQLTGISVTTAGLPEAKSKAFEVMHRARQIGGEESHGILVANLSYDNQAKVDRVAEMQTDINFLLTGSTSDYFNVIGRDDWESNKLKEKLEEILWK